MKVSNDVVKIYGTAQEQKSEVKIEADKVTGAVKGDELQWVPETATQMKNVGASLPAEVRQALEVVFGKDMLLSKEEMQALKTYLEKFPGSLDEKIKVIEALLSKDLDINITNLKLVQEALFGREMREIIKDLGFSFDSIASRSEAKDMQSLANEVKNLLFQGISLNKICDYLESGILNSDISSEAKGILQKAANEGRQAASYRMDDLGQKIILKAIKDASGEEIKGTKQEASESLGKNNPDTLFEIQEEIGEEYAKAVLGAGGLGGKSYLMVEITSRLKEAAQSFREFKKDIANNLDMAVRYLKESGMAGIQSAKTSLQKTIDSLDKIILKSDIALFADMKLEKELVRADSELQKAKLLLDKGEYEKAWKLADKVRSTVESLNWKPSNSRIIHYANLKEGFTESENPEDKLKSAFKGLGENFANQDYSPRKVYEALRLLGGDHEGETARFLAEGSVKEEDINNNVKSLLLKLSEKDGSAAELVQKISGNQLLNREGNGPIQTMFFALPLLINGSVSDMKVYINSQKDEKKLDWQNCSIFFLIDTKRLGETGVLLQASGGNLSITVKNDREDLKERVSPLLTGFKENLKELGYEVGTIGFARLNANEEEKSISSNRMIKTGANSINPIKKGFDIKI